jgi:hypothetical protein
VAARSAKRDFGAIALAGAAAEPTAFTSVPRPVTSRTRRLLVCQTDSVGDERPDTSVPLGIVPASPLACLTLPANTASQALGAGHHRLILHTSRRKEFESSDEFESLSGLSIRVPCTAGATSWLHGNVAFQAIGVAERSTCAAIQMDCGPRTDGIAAMKALGQSLQ